MTKRTIPVACCVALTVSPSRLRSTHNWRQPQSFPPPCHNAFSRIIDVVSTGVLHSAKATAVENLHFTNYGLQVKSECFPSVVRTQRCYFRSRCFSEIERMINLPRLDLANGGSACASAASSNSSTSGLRSVATPSSLTNRFCFPLPCKIPLGSGRVAP